MIEIQVGGGDHRREPWDSQPGEPARSYARFVGYRDLGPERSLALLARSGKLSVSLRQLEDNSTRWNWVDRAQAYDLDQDRKRRAANEKARMEMVERHAKIAMLGQNILIEALRHTIEDVKEKGRKVSVADLARLMDVSVKVERLSRGEATDISQREHAGPGGGPIEIKAVKAMSDQEIHEAMVLALTQSGKSLQEAEHIIQQVIE